MSVDNNDITALGNQGRNGFDPAAAQADQTDMGMLADDDMPDMSEMARLLDEQDVQFRSIKRGDVVEGQIVRIDPEEILVDIGLKSEGVLSTRELPPNGYGSLTELHVGDNVLVYIMQPETPEGHAVVSIKRARLERQWRIAQEQYERGELLEAEVIDYNKGGLIVNLEGIRGFVPISQILNLKREDTADNAETQQKLSGMVGRRLQLKIIEINRNRNPLILSERLAVQEWRAKRREELLSELQVGEVRKGVVSNLSNFGAFVDLGGADGLVHISQLAWSRVNHPSEVMRVGQEVEVQVLSVDKEKKKIALSIKRAEVDPWTTVESRYHINQLVRGTITKIAPFGAFARIEDGVEGLIHLSELPVGVNDPKQVLKEGQEVSVRILRIDAERRRLGLSIRQADEGAEAAPGIPGHEEEPLVTEPQALVSAEEAVEGRADVAASSAEQPAPEAVARRRPAQTTQREDAPTTAMAAAFAAAQRQRDGANATPVQAEASQAQMQASMPDAAEVVSATPVLSPDVPEAGAIEPALEPSVESSATGTATAGDAETTEVSESTPPQAATDETVEMSSAAAEAPTADDETPAVETLPAVEASAEDPTAEKE